MMPRGRSASKAPTSARWLPLASNSTSKLPFSAVKRARPSGASATLTTSSAPTFSALPSVCAPTSVATMCVAPARRAAMIASAPIGPQPVTSTRLPSSEPARRTACSATDSGSAIEPSPSLTRVGQPVRLASARTTICWRKAPCTCGVRIALP